MSRCVLRMRLSPRVSSLFFITSLALATGLPSLAADAPLPKRQGGGGKGGRGGAGTAPQWWREIDTGPFIADTFLNGPTGDVVALKGLAIKLGGARDVSVVFDTELLCWRAGFDGAVLLNGTPWDGAHGGNSHYPAGDAIFFFQNTPATLGIAVNGEWRDPRSIKAGPLPSGVGRYRGLFRHGNEVVLHYTVGGVKVLELPAVETISGVRAITRTLNVDANANADLELLVRENVTTGLKSDAQVYLIGAP